MRLGEEVTNIPEAMTFYTGFKKTNELRVFRFQTFLEEGYSHQPKSWYNESASDQPIFTIHASWEKLKTINMTNGLVSYLLAINGFLFSLGGIS